MLKKLNKLRKLNKLWREADSAAEKADYHNWDIYLDKIYLELPKEHKFYAEITKSIISSRSKLHHLMMRKSIWLRALINKECQEEIKNVRNNVQ